MIDQPTGAVTTGIPSGGANPTNIAISSSTPTTTPPGLPSPTTGETFNVVPIEGKVKRQCPGEVKFIPVTEPEQLVIGCRLDLRRGRVLLTSSAGQNRGTQTAEFFDGLVAWIRRRGARRRPSSPSTVRSSAGAAEETGAAPGPSSTRSRGALGEGQREVQEQGRQGFGGRSRHHLVHRRPVRRLDHREGHRRLRRLQRLRQERRSSSKRGDVRGEAQEPVVRSSRGGAWRRTRELGRGRASRPVDLHPSRRNRGRARDRPAAGAGHLVRRPHCDACSPTASRTRWTTRRWPTSSPSPRPSAATRRSSGSAT